MAKVEAPIPWAKKTSRAAANISSLLMVGVRGMN
jgi:hypothetical protein